MSDTKEYCEQVNEYNERVASKSGINIGRAKTTIEVLRELAEWLNDIQMRKLDEDMKDEKFVKGFNAGYLFAMKDYILNKHEKEGHRNEKEILKSTNGD